ncbi:TspO/MBR family protein [Spirillospora sp. NPDC047279]|uniref:TspO/MBR family protein n=1 Tax=Spirillospora sp. NPDC047279 TaxID=3155478 RepID=UPI00340B57E7
MKKDLVVTSAAVTTAAGAGVLATDPDSDWYRELSKPPWQPPSAAFGLVWTPLYATIAYASARALDKAGNKAGNRAGNRAGGKERRAIGALLGTNLALNSGWSALFFGAKRPRAALAEIVLLNAANVALARRLWRTDRPAGALLLPYLAWTGFATVLNASIVRRNPRTGAAHDRRSPV